MVNPLALAISSEPPCFLWHDCRLGYAGREVFHMLKVSMYHLVVYMERDRNSSVANGKNRARDPVDFLTSAHLSHNITMLV